ncbi:hypothetical protein BFW38_16790 [Terasakiispira papahanaumokuakeensis]|uniref:Sulfate transporter CysZ n=1 Tax=Terasakiispira papahanaumokuakeensis TaxID=197479 RepID=A0A1E2VDB6_9GAMM|nr:sulfate transporter CysZ [Terasakiispira papahanaumokuakeensis]ODC04943.1 hypothetical protein BFW38_16790 [Terasakiispira papahanaumokuakeensis]
MNAAQSDGYLPPDVFRRFPLFRALTAPFHVLAGFALVTRPRLRPFIWAPLLINLLTFGLTAWGGIVLFDTYLSEWLTGYPQWLAWLVWPFFILALLLAFGSVFTLFGQLLTAPFLGLLAEYTEAELSGKRPDTSESWGQLLTRTLSRELSKLRWMLPRLLLLIVLSWIPGLNLLAPVAWALFAAWSMALQYLDYPMDNHKVTFAQMRQQMLERRLHCLMFGGTLALLSWIPLINLVLLPAATAGATRFWWHDFAALSQPAPVPSVHS